MAKSTLSIALGAQISTTLIHTIFVDRTNLVGRPQKHAKLTLDLSGVESLVTEHGEKPVRLAAFAQVRETLGLGADVVITRHPKDDSAWVIKGAALTEDVVAVVSPV